MPIKKFNYRNHAENIPLYEERGFTTFEESLNDNPIQWKKDWMVWYRGRIDDQKILKLNTKNYIEKIINIML